MTADSERDVDALYGLYCAAPGYFYSVKRRKPVRADATESLNAVPPAGHRAVEKIFGGYWRAGELVGCSDIVYGYPDRSVMYIGLLLFREGMQGKGYGPVVLGDLYEAAIRRGCTRTRLSVIDTNRDAYRFWRREGYREIATRTVDGYAGRAVVMGRELELTGSDR